MSRTSLTRFVVTALALVFGFALMAVDSRGDGSKGKKVGQNQIVHGCIESVTESSGKGDVVFKHPKWGGKVKVDDKTTTILICGEKKTLKDLKTAVEKAAKDKTAPFCGIARIDNRKDLNALKIIVCNDGDDD